MEYTKRHNLNRGYMKLDVWNDAVQLFQIVNLRINEISNLEYKLKSQILDATQSISSNIAEGYCRKSINEYLYYLNVALGSCGEVLTRTIGLKVTYRISNEIFEEIDKLHFAVENKLLGLIKALQSKKYAGTWEQKIHEPVENYNSIEND